MNSFPSPPWGRGWRATGVVISRGETGEGVNNRGYVQKPGKRRASLEPGGFAVSFGFDFWLCPNPVCLRISPRAKDAQQAAWCRGSRTASSMRRRNYLCKKSWTLCGRYRRRSVRRSAICPLTRLAPADDGAGCDPPSPPRGRGLGISKIEHFVGVETPGPPACWRPFSLPLAETNGHLRNPASKLAGRKAAASCRTPKLRSCASFADCGSAANISSREGALKSLWGHLLVGDQMSRATAENRLAAS